MIVRISKGRFEPDRLDDVERLLAASEDALRDSLQALPGLLRYYVGCEAVAALSRAASPAPVF